MKLKFYYVIVVALAYAYFFPKNVHAQVMIAPPGRSELYLGAATDTPYTQQIDFFIQNIDKSAITTGILYDRSFPIANLEAHNGLPTDDTTTSDQFIQAYSELYNSAYNNAGRITPTDFHNAIINSDQDNTHKIGLLTFDYQYLDTSAVRNNQFYIQNNKLYDTPGRTGSPFMQKRSYLISPLFPTETRILQGQHQFVFDPNKLLSNWGGAIQTLTVDFGDGYGVRTLVSNGSPTGPVTANLVGKSVFYASFTGTMTNGATIVSVSKISVKEKFPDPVDCSGGDIIDLVGLPFDASAYGMGSNVSAEGRAYIYYANANCSSRQVTKPIVFIDGFDPSTTLNYDPKKSRGVSEIYQKFINQEVTLNNTQVKLADKFRADGYDIIILDYKNGNDLIEKNGLLVVKLLQELYSRYSGTMQTDFVLIGPSMGALVAQYALSYAETNNIPTHTRLYISFDGPHQGANAPIGVQQLADYIFQKGYVGDLYPGFKYGLHRGAAARQMLVHSSATGSESPSVDNFRNIFLNNLNAVGKYPNPTHNPNSIRKVAIINGSNQESPNAFLAPTSPIMDVVLKRAILGFLPGRFGKRIDWHLKASPNAGRNITADLFTFAPFINIAIWQGAFRKYYATPAFNNQSYDATVGSYFENPKDLNGEYKADGFFPNLAFQSLTLLLVGGRTPYITTNLNTTFIPTTSAIDLQTSTPRLTYNFSNENIVCTGKTPFDRVYAPSSSQNHVQITNENAAWFVSEITGVGITPQPGGLEQSNASISGVDNFCGTQTFTLINQIPNTSVSWSVNGPATIVSQSGNQVTIQQTQTQTGNATLNATMFSSCGSTPAIRTVYVGPIPPAVTVTTDRTPQGSNYIYESASAQLLSGTTQSNYVWYDETDSTPGNYITSGTFLNQWPIPPCTLKKYRLEVTTSCGIAVYRNYVYNSYGCGYRLAYSPNPANESMTIKPMASAENEKMTSEPYNFRLYDKQGNILRQGKSNSKYEAVIDTRNIPSDNYFLHIIYPKETIKNQIVIQH